MVLTITDNFAESEVGGKARVLQTLHSQGYSVPAFVVLPVSSVHEFSVEDGQLVSEVQNALQSDSYAVRSAALLEDTAESAMAGQFSTKLAVKPSELTAAVQAVIDQAKTVAGFSIGKLSVIIQEFVEPDYAGVLFTRNPVGGYEQVCEYVAGRGEQVVSGQRVQKTFFYTDPAEQTALKLPFAAELYAVGTALEKLFAHPQDIEWAYKAGELYVLQSRAITTLSARDFHCVQKVSDQILGDPTYLAQTSITEAFARPTPLSLSVLRYLYSQSGPIAHAYKKVGVDYTDTDQFTQLGNQLYINKQAELKALFPAKGYLKHRSAKPRFETVSGIWRTVKNTYQLQSVRTNHHFIDTSQLTEYLRRPPVSSYTEAKTAINLHYPEVFTINLFCKLALQKLHSMARDTKLVESLLLQTQADQELNFSPDMIAGTLCGNSLSLDDTSTFLAADLTTDRDPRQVAHNWKAKALLPKAVEVQNLMRLRELGRWVTVKLVSELRESILHTDSVQSLSDPQLMYFATLSELEDVLPEEATLVQRKRRYEEENQCTYPAVVTNVRMAEEDRATGQLSPGIASGVLCTLDSLSSSTEPKILLVDSLQPELTATFSQVAGIVCKQGGMLSHLAIMAREAGLPVLLVSTVHESWLGEVVEITADGRLRKTR